MDVADFPAVFFKLCHGRQQIKIQIQFKVELGNQLLVELNVDEMALLLSTSKEVQAVKGRDRYGEHGRECPLMKVKWRSAWKQRSPPPRFFSLFVSTNLCLCLHLSTQAGRHDFSGSLLSFRS